MKIECWVWVSGSSEMNCKTQLEIEGKSKYCIPIIILIGAMLTNIDNYCISTVGIVDKVSRYVGTISQNIDQY